MSGITWPVPSLPLPPAPPLPSNLGLRQEGQDAGGSTAQLRSARHGEAGAICCLAETIATVICRHAEDWRAPAVSDVTVHFETGCEEKENAQDSAGLEKAGGSSSFKIGRASCRERVSSPV